MKLSGGSFFSQLDQMNNEAETRSQIYWRKIFKCNRPESGCRHRCTFPFHESSGGRLVKDARKQKAHTSWTLIWFHFMLMQTAQCERENVAAWVIRLLGFRASSLQNDASFHLLLSTPSPLSLEHFKSRHAVQLAVIWPEWSLHANQHVAVKSIPRFVFIVCGSLDTFRRF